MFDSIAGRGAPHYSHRIASGDRIRLGRGGGADLVCHMGSDTISFSRSNTGARDDLRQITVLLDGFRSLGSGRVLQEVLAIVLDAAIELSGAERALIMLGGADGVLEFKLARGRGKVSLTDSTFAVSQKIPEEVFRVGQLRVVTDLLDRGLADVHQGTVALGIRHIVCVPLNLVQSVDAKDAQSEDRRIGVLYLDSREKGNLLSEVTQRALETLAAQALGHGGHITVWASRNDGWFTLEVEDDGPGIPAAQRTQIFDPFFTTKPEGTGLGLSISYGLVKEHGGRLEVQSRTREETTPGTPTGTTVRVVLPVGAETT